MIGIKEITRGRFGNRILQYNVMYQVSQDLGIPNYCARWEGHDWFEGLIGGGDLQQPQTTLNWSNFHDDSYKELVRTLNCTIDGTLLHNFFYKLTKINPREIFKIKEQFNPNFPEGSINVGIHFRGDDKLKVNNGREIHSIDYYIRGLEVILNDSKVDVIHVCTDDTSFGPYKKFIEHVKNNVGIELKLGPATNGGPHILDFAVLSECDYILSNSSTYPVCAGFIGKENKKIVHSLEWIEKNLPESYVKWGTYNEKYPKAYWNGFDNFWIQVYEGGNEFYKAWKIL
jgi:hypothetical protein